MPHGKICHLEIPANTAEASAAFYSSIFAWKVRARGDGNLAFDDTGGVSGINFRGGTTDKTQHGNENQRLHADGVGSGHRPPAPTRSQSLLERRPTC